MPMQAAGASNRPTSLQPFGQVPCRAVCSVAALVDGEQVSFLIPAEFAQALVQRAASAQPITQAAHAEMTRQLMEHQQMLTDRFLKAPFREQRHGNYRLPVPDDALARC